MLVGATWSGLGDRWPVRISGDFVRNFGAVNSEDTGSGIDVAFGRASKASDWRVTYGYSVAETEAVLAAFSHDNLSLATNYELQSLTLDFVPTPKTMVSAIWYHYRPYHEASAALSRPGDWLDRVRLAFLVSF